MDGPSLEKKDPEVGSGRWVIDDAPSGRWETLGPRFPELLRCT